MVQIFTLYIARSTKVRDYLIYGILSTLDPFYFMMVNCGGGIVDVTVHEIRNQNDCFITEVHKFSELIYSSVGKYSRRSFHDEHDGK